MRPSAAKFRSLDPTPWWVSFIRCSLAKPAPSHPLPGRPDRSRALLAGRMLALLTAPAVVFLSSATSVSRADQARASMVSGLASDSQYARALDAEMGLMSMLAESDEAWEMTHHYGEMMPTLEVSARNSVLAPTACLLLSPRLAQPHTSRLASFLTLLTVLTPSHDHRSCRTRATC